MSANVTIPDTTATAGPTYAQIFGPVFWGFCVALILCGVSLLQGYLYFTRFNDKLGIRLLAYMMLTFDILSTALVCQSVYYYMLPHFGSLAPLNAVTRELTVECLIAAVITFTSQMYFVYQLHMAKTPGITAKIMKALVVVLATVGLAGASGCVGIMFMFPENIFMHRNRAFAILAGIARGFGAGADIIATIAMCMFLQSAKTGIRRTSSMLQSLMHLIINRAILVTAAQTLLLIAFFATSQHLYWLAVHINTTKLYVNTFFGMLNARSALQDRNTVGVMSLSTNESTIINQRSLMFGTKNAAATQKGELNDAEYALDIHVATSRAVAEI